MRASILFVVLQQVVFSQQPMSGPVEGFVFDKPTGSFRALNGFLGSASFGPAIMSGEELFEAGFVAPRKDFGLGFLKGKGTLLTDLGGAPGSIDLGEGMLAPDGVAWSGDASMAVLFSKKDAWIQTISGLPSAPRLGNRISVAPLGPIGSVAVHASGPVVFATAGENAGIYRLASDAAFEPIVRLAKPTSLSFSETGDRLYALDATLGRLLSISMRDFTADSSPLSGLASPVAVFPGLDAAKRRVIYAAGNGDWEQPLLVAYDAETLVALASAELNFQPTLIEPLGRNSFLLRSRADIGDPLWSFANTEQPSVFFVPATPIAGGSR